MGVFVALAAASSNNFWFCTTCMNGARQPSGRNWGLVICLWFLLEEEIMSFSTLLLEKGHSRPTQTQHRLKILNIFFQGSGEKKHWSLSVRGGACLYWPRLCLWPGTMTVYLTCETKVHIISDVKFLWEFTEFCASTHSLRVNTL